LAPVLFGKRLLPSRPSDLAYRFSSDNASKTKTTARHQGPERAEPCCRSQPCSGRVINSAGHQPADGANSIDEGVIDEGVKGSLFPDMVPRYRATQELPMTTTLRLIRQRNEF
jgi:hypothetical protein